VRRRDRYLARFFCFFFYEFSVWASTGSRALAGSHNDSYLGLASRSQVLLDGGYDADGI